MQRVLRLLLPGLALALAAAAALILVYPMDREVEARPLAVLVAYTETETGTSTFVEGWVSTETRPQTLVRTEVEVVMEGFTTLKTGKWAAETYYRLPGLKAGDIITIEAGPQVRVWITGPSGEKEAESDTGEVSHRVEGDGEYKVWLKAEELKEAREVFIGVSRPNATYTETWEAYTTYRWSTTVTKTYVSTRVSASTLTTYKTVTRQAPTPQKIWLAVPLLAVAASMAAASILMWRFKPAAEEEIYYEEVDDHQPFEEQALSKNY
ncbi:MAG: hypothetical protein QW176_03180 [Candidatus Bathyarchaeia archaeon]